MFFFSARLKTLGKLIKKQGTYNTFFVTPHYSPESHLCTSVHPCQDQKQAQEYIARSAAFNILSFNQTGCG